MFSSLRFLLTLALCASLPSCVQAQFQIPAVAPAKKSTLRTLIVSGGPDAEYNQYAIESNARYLEKLTAHAASQRILFADGNKNSRTISTLQPTPNAEEEIVFGWIFDEDESGAKTVYRAPTLKRIDGPSNKKSVLQNVQKLAAEMENSEHGLLYFTGHGSTGTSKLGALLGGRFAEDLENTTYSLWGDDELSVKELAGALKQWPQDVPLVLVMVQCHAGGFTNIMFQDGDPKSPLWERNFCGFFAATAEREASGCTSEVDERDYQDFTTHFFAALSGHSRDGGAVYGADYDHNGAVSLLEAYAWTNLQDASNDVPVCTSDAYLRHIFAAREDASWMQTPYSALVAAATPWQKAMLNGLSKRLALQGEKRIVAANNAHKRLENGEGKDPTSAIDTDELSEHFYGLETTLKQQFPGLKAPHRTARFTNAKQKALGWMKKHPTDVKVIAEAYKQWTEAENQEPVREAMLWRFIRTARTVVLQKRLATRGTAEQKAVFARLRMAESRNPLFP